MRGTLTVLSAGKLRGSLVFGTTDYAPGELRISFVLLRPDGRLVTRPQSQVWLARSLNDRPVAVARAQLESTTAPGASVAAGGSSRLYVAHVRVSNPGRYAILVRAGDLVASDEQIIQKTTRAPTVGSRAFPSVTPTVASSRGDPRRITTHVPPDRALLQHSVAATLKAHLPFVLVFASPAFCPNRTCGPIVDVVDAVRQRFRSSRIRFIHVEPYTHENPGLGFNRWARQWKLPSEPFTFIVDRDGRIKAKFEGSVSVHELAAAVKRVVAETP